MIFNAKLGSLRKRFKKEIDFTFVRAPHKVPSQDGTGEEDTDENGMKEILIRVQNFSYYHSAIAPWLNEHLWYVWIVGYGWWFNIEDHVFKATVPSDLCVGFEDSVAVIEKIFLEQGPFDGILGFSQGAAFVSILCAMKKKNSKFIK